MQIYLIPKLQAQVNALGKLRFTLVNTPSIYLHDTPDRHLFNRSARNFSSGCIRLERPLEMVEYVLRRNAGTPWTQEQIRSHLASNRDRNAVGAARPVTVPRSWPTVDRWWPTVPSWSMGSSVGNGPLPTRVV